MMRVASEETNSRSCDTKIKVPSNNSNAMFNDSIDSISMWLVGSSMISTLWLPIISLPNSKRPFSPPEHTLTDFFISSWLNNRRSEERRVGKECRYRWLRYHEKEKAMP